jgi:hypothetical protein
LVASFFSSSSIATSALADVDAPLHVDGQHQLLLGGLDRGGLGLGRFTLTPCWMRGAVTMKMMSSTSITSTMGVTLISLMVTRPPEPRLEPMPMARVP